LSIVENVLLNILAILKGIVISITTEVMMDKLCCFNTSKNFNSKNYRTFVSKPLRLNLLAGAKISGVFQISKSFRQIFSTFLHPLENLRAKRVAKIRTIFGTTKSFR
ncbi:hypothetical protein, partial [Alistipes indistinctus]|uniref:hypothetical protein n=1 Tax=Alistipes indistinctus TaxID=626932 RepID=UPI0036F3E04A